MARKRKDPYAHMAERSKGGIAGALRGTKKRRKAVAAPARGRGRPAGSRNKAKLATEWSAYTASQTTKKRRGRPPGSRNKKSAEAVATRRTKRQARMAKRAAVRAAPKQKPITSYWNKKSASTGVKRGRGRPKGSLNKTRSTSAILNAVKASRLARAAARAAAANKRGRGRPRKNVAVSTGVKRGRGRPKGAKDKSPRKRRGSSTRAVAAPAKVSRITKPKLSRRGESAAAKVARTPKAANVRAVVHRTPTVKVGTVKATRGKLRSSRA